MSVDPISMMMIASTAFQAVGFIQQGLAAKAEGDFQSALAQRQAVIDQQNADAEAARIREDARRLKARQVAAFGKSGVALQGTPAELLAQTEADSELDQLTVLRKGKLDAQTSLLEGAAAKTKARTKATSSLLSAGATIAGSEGVQSLLKKG